MEPKIDITGTSLAKTYQDLQAKQASDKFNAFKGQTGGAEAGGMITQDGIKPITKSDLIPITPISLPETTSVPIPEVTFSPTTVTGNAESDLFKQMLASKEELPSELDAAKKLEEEAGLEEKRKLSEVYTNKLNESKQRQLNEINNLDKIQGITSAGKESMAQDINRKFYFEQANLAVLQSVYQNDYLGAQSHVDKLMGYVVKDAENRVNSKNKQIEAIYGFLSEQQKAKAQELKDSRSTNLSQLSASVNDARTYANGLINDSPAIASQILALVPPDASSKTFTEDLQRYNADVAAIVGRAPVGSAGGLSASLQSDFAEGLSYLSTLKTRDDAVDFLNKNKTAITFKYGAPNFNLMVNEIDRLFPKEPMTDESKKIKTTSIKSPLTGRGYTPPVVKPEPLKGLNLNKVDLTQKLSPSVTETSSFFSNLFGG